MTETKTFFECDYLNSNESFFKQEKVSPPGRAITKNSGKTLSNDNNSVQVAESKPTLPKHLPRTTIKMTRSNHTRHTVKSVMDMLRNRTNEIMQKAANKIDDQILEEYSMSKK